MMRLVSVCCAAIRLHQWPWPTSTGSVFRGFVCFLIVRAILKCDINWLGATHWLVSSVDRWGLKACPSRKSKPPYLKPGNRGNQQPQKWKTTRVVLSRYLCERAKSDAVQQVMGGGSSYRCGVTGKLSITVASVWVTDGQVYLILSAQHLSELQFHEGLSWVQKETPEQQRRQAPP